MSDIEILIGDSWHDGRMGERIRLEGGMPGGIDFSAVLGTLDILVRGANVSSSARDDAIFLLLRDMIVGCEDLASGRSRRVSIPFYESPWELVLCREVDRVLVSLYRGGPIPRVEVKDASVPLADLACAIVEAGDRLVGRLESLNPVICADPFLGEMLGALERLRACRPSPSPAPDGDEVEIACGEVGPEGSDLGFRCRVRATGRDLLGPVTPDRADLYALMARGTLSCLVRGEEIVSFDGYVIFMIESLLGAARHLLGCLEEHRDLDVSIPSDSLLVEMRYEAQADKLTVTLACARGGEKAVLGAVPLVAFVDAVLALARDFKQGTLEKNPSQHANLRFELLAGEIETLGAWRRDLTDSTLVNTGRALRYEAPTLPRRGDGRASVPRRLMYAKRWEAEAEGLRLDATFLCGDRVVVGTRNIIAALDRETGDQLWSQRGLPVRALALMTGEAGLLTVAPTGEVEMIDVAEGEVLWATRIPPPPGKPAGFTAGGGRRPRYALLTSEESGLVAVDLFTGESRWRFRTRRGSPAGFARTGRFVAFTCRSNSVYCLDVDSGDLVWRFSERSRFDLPPVALREALAVWGPEHGGSRGRLFVLDSLTGETLWVAGSGGRPLARPILARGHLVMALGTDRGPVLEAWAAAGGEPGWRRDLDGSDVAVMSMDDDVLVHTSAGTVESLDGATGRVRWTCRLAEGPSSDLPLSLEPVLRDGGLFVPFDTTYVLNPLDGTLLHRLESGSPVPDLLRVDENYSIYTAEVSGHLSAYGVVGHLGVVRT